MNPLDQDPAPIGEPSPAFPVRYFDGAQVLKIKLIAAWDRGDIPAAVMSASSGPKDYMKNEIYALFEKAQKVNRIAMCRGRGPTFYLYRSGALWFDATGRQVVIDAAA